MVVTIKKKLNLKYFQKITYTKSIIPFYTRFFLSHKHKHIEGFTSQALKHF